MLTIETELGLSAVHGIGLFSTLSIPAGTPIWKFNDNVDFIYPHDSFVEMCRAADQLILRHFLNATYRRGGLYYYLTDNARFINHSEDLYNVAFLDDLTEVAVRDIAAGEELLENYFLSYDPVDFFFQEVRNPDPHVYVQSLINQQQRVSHA